MAKAGTFTCRLYRCTGITKDLCLKRVVAFHKCGDYKLCGVCEIGMEIHNMTPADEIEDSS